MDISKLTINLKHRTSWSAIDLGFLFAREHYGLLIVSWMIISFPLFILTQLFSPNTAFWGVLLIWWLKPFWDRGPLYIISKALFAEQVSLRELFQQYRHLLTKSAFAWLTYKRFNASRSFVQPVVILEGLTGRKLSKRLATLQYRSGSAPTWLTIVCVHFEMILILGIYALIVMLIPQEADIDYWQMLTEDDGYYDYLSNTLIYLSSALIAPFYVCAGFMLYINRRILLEGWDIEIQFRVLAEQLQAQNAVAHRHDAHSHHTNANTGTTLMAAVCLTLISTFFATQPLCIYAETTNTQTAQTQPLTYPVNNAEDAKHLINEVFKGEDFNNKIQVKLYRLREPAEQQDNEELSWWQRWIYELWLKSLLDSLDELFLEKEQSWFLTLSKLVEIILWLVLTSVIVYVAIIATSWYRRYKPAGFNTDKPVRKKPSALFGFDMQKPHTQHNVSSTAAKRWAQRDYREALALLYGSLLSRLIHDYDFDFREGYTEQECALIVASSTQQRHQRLKPYVKQLTHYWLQVAYGHQTPSADIGEQLCQQWSELFNEH